MMSNPNHLAGRLTIRPPERDALCEIEFSDRRHDRRLEPLERPVRVTLCNGAFEASFLATYEDMKAMRDWLDRAMAAIEQKDALSPLEMGVGSDG